MKKTVLMILIAALSTTLLFISCAGDEEDTVLAVGNIPSDYIIRWHLDGNGIDEKEGYDLNFDGNFTYSSTDQKEGTHCLSLDGSYVLGRYGDHSLANDAVTILMWLYVDASATGIPNALRYVNNGINYDTSSNLFQAYIGTDNVASSSVSFDRDQWHHVVLTFDGSLDTINLYVDNTGPYTNTSTDSIAGLDNEWFVGSNWFSDYWNGMIDDVIIYERALSDAEVRALYN